MVVNWLVVIGGMGGLWNGILEDGGAYAQVACAP